MRWTARVWAASGGEEGQDKGGGVWYSVACIASPATVIISILLPCIPRGVILVVAPAWYSHWSTFSLADK